MKLLTDAQAQPVALFFALTKKYDHAWLEWLPATLKVTVDSDFGIKMPTLNMSKALGAAALVTHNSFWTEWEVFHFMVQALNGQAPTAHQMQEHTVGQMMAAVDDANYLREHVSGLIPHPPFSDAMARYIAAQALAQNVWWLPEPLAFASGHASGEWYRCKDCGNESEVLFDDKHCDVCTDRFSTEGMGSWVKDPELVKRGVGKNIEFFFRNPPDEVKARYNSVVGQENPTLTGSQTDTCVGRLLYARHYVAARRALRTAQLAAL